MRKIEYKDIVEAVKNLCIDANYNLEEDVCAALKRAKDTETNVVGRSVLNQLEENLKIASKDLIPICQDTGMAVIFVEMGQEVQIVGGFIEDAINEGVRIGYEEGYLRKSIVKDPIVRENTKDNTPAVIHYEMKNDDSFKITIAPKGFGSENMSRVYMLKPADGIEGVKNAIYETVREAGPNACPPFVVGVGLGGDFEKATLLSKKALTRKIGEKSFSKYRLPYVDDLEKELLENINKENIGPAGLGGDNTALAVHIETYPTHIAGLPLAINICCHVNRHKSISL